MKRVARASMIGAGVCALLVALAWHWTSRTQDAVLRSITNFDLPAQSRLESVRESSTRFGAEGIRIWRAELPAADAHALRAACESMDYSLRSSRDLARANPVLAEYLSPGGEACVRQIRRDFLGISVIQETTLVVAILH